MFNLQQTMHEWLHDFNRLTKSINPDAAHVTYFIEEWPERPLDDIDILIDENHNLPYVEDGALTYKSRGYKVGDARERIVLVVAPPSWRRVLCSGVSPQRTRAARRWHGSQRC